VRDQITSVAIPADVHDLVAEALLQPDGWEDVCFALWTPSCGAQRLTALVHTPIRPQPGERERHGNVTFQPGYFERALDAAVRSGCGICLMHSHPSGRGWQRMSPDDVQAERKLASAADAVTDLPLVGMTLAGDGTWSARFWRQLRGRTYRRYWSEGVRRVGKRLQASFFDGLAPVPEYRELFRRTRTVWGSEAHQSLARLRIGIVGLGSVGSLVAEALARSGLQRFVLIDFDEVEPHNLDRLAGATVADVGGLKVDVAKAHIERCRTAANTDVRPVPFSLAEEPGYRAALDCDVLFSCVDRPRARQILNHFAYAHLIPVIDGGIQVRFKAGAFSGADWQVQTVGPARACLQCLRQFDPSDADTERAGMLDDPSYMQGLPSSHRLKANENVFPFSMNLASLEVMHLVAVATAAGRQDDFGIQRFRYMPGVLDQDDTATCLPECDMAGLAASGDSRFCLTGPDVAAEAVRARRAERIAARDHG
jgi:molybdopterin/thiamine biosynthesis adenylyltransferase